MPYEAGADRPLLTVAEATTVLRIGRSLGYQLAREYLASGGTTGLPVIRLGYGHLEVAHASTIHAAQSATSTRPTPSPPTPWAPTPSTSP